MKQFVNAIDKNGSCFAYVGKKMCPLSTENIITGIFDGPKIRQLIKDLAFVNLMNETERKTWTSFFAVVREFLGKSKA